VPPLVRWTAGESCANTQVAYDFANQTFHAGRFLCTPVGFAQNECGYGPVNSCLQEMFDEGPRPPNCGAGCGEHGHFINMTNPAYTRVACGFAGSWSVQNFE
jgi:hypothetical protein